jgi:hypothetical protein
VKIEISQPHPDYPLAYVRVPLTTDVDSLELAGVLAKKRISLLGRWEPDFRGSQVTGIKAPVLLEDEYIPLPKKRPVRSKR